MAQKERITKVLFSVIEEYVKTGQPVGSKTITDKYLKGVSPATVRNILARLEYDGYLIQPHTSAGRIPTEKAYIFYISQATPNTAHSEGQKKFTNAVEQADSEESAVKNVAKALADFSNDMALAVFDKNRSYYTGVSKLFGSLEENDIGFTRELFELIDRFDEVIGEVFHDVPTTPRAFIGSENPFGSSMSSIMVKYKLPNNTNIMLGIVGPMRMDYIKNVKLLFDAVESLKEIDK